MPARAAATAMRLTSTPTLSTEANLAAPQEAPPEIPAVPDVRPTFVIARLYTLRLLHLALARTLAGACCRRRCLRDGNVANRRVH